MGRTWGIVKAGGGDVLGVVGSRVGLEVVRGREGGRLRVLEAAKAETGPTSSPCQLRLALPGTLPAALWLSID